MIISHLSGGLGNQMFQYAAGLALAERHRTVLKLDVRWFRHYPGDEPHNRYSLNCFNVSEQFATKQEVDYLRGRGLTTIEKWSVRMARKLDFRIYPDSLQRHGTSYFTKTFRYDAAFEAATDNTYLEGYWQCDKYFSPVANLLRLHFSFRYPPQPRVAEFMAQIASGPSVAVHFRRGDYVREKKINERNGVLPLDYYYRAVELVRARHPDVTLYIFSDEIESIRQEFHPPGRHVYVDAVEPWHAYDDMRLMSLCNHAVISNSTFSWWAAWLSPSKTKMVIAPEPWFAGNEHDGRDVIPDQWMRLPVRAAEHARRPAQLENARA